MDNLGMLRGEQWIEISEGFDYISATKDFIGLKLFPMFRTDNMKLAVASLLEGAKVPVMAVVHALDAEAQIADRPDFKEMRYELLLVKRKLNQGEALRKKIRDLGMSSEDRAVIEAVYNDAANLIAQVITRFEVMADEALCTGKLTIDENDVDVTVDYGLDDKHRLVVSSWSSAAHDILGDLVKIQNVAKGKIVRALVPDKVMSYLTGNSKINSIAAVMGEYVTEAFVKNYIASKFGIELVKVGGTYKLNHQSSTEYNFFDEDTIVFLTTDGTLGYTYMTSTPEEDLGIATATTGFVTVSQNITWDPATLWTKASAVGFPAFRDINQLYICKVSS